MVTTKQLQSVPFLTAVTNTDHYGCDPSVDFRFLSVLHLTIDGNKLIYSICFHKESDFNVLSDGG